MAVRSDGSKNTATIRSTRNSEFSYTHLKYNVDSYFRDVVVGTDTVTANLFSIKLLLDTAYKTNISLEYKLLNSSQHSSVNFLNLFTGASIGTVFAATGLTSYFGKDIDTEFGAFLNLNYPMENKAEFFIEYSTLDFMKIFQNTSIASAAKNIGVFSTSNAPKDALSFGFILFLSDKLSSYFKIYDIEQQMRPALGVGYKY